MTAAIMSIAIATATALAGANPAWPPSDPQLSAEALSAPESMPDDPAYAPRGDPVVGCAGQHDLYSFTPGCTPEIGDEERARGLGSGIHADRAWLWTIGRGEVAIAVAGAGIDWSDVELVARFRLNAGELPPPQTSTTPPGIHDLNGDGAFTVLDYTSATGTTAPAIALVNDLALLRRGDRGDANGNGLLDPGDLLAIYSNAIDEDTNGYVDDLAGWDFVDEDNDAADTSDDTTARFARAAAATANNGVAGAGVCPACTLIPLRIAGRNLAGGNELGAALIFAADAGARVFATEVSAAGGSTLIDRAVSYAWSRDLVIVAGAGRAASARREVLWDPARVLIVGAIGYDRLSTNEATTAIAPDPFGNFGAQIALTAPGPYPAALAAGAVALAASAALGIPRKNVPALELPISAGELRGLIAASAKQLDGRTRVDARAAIDAVIQRRIPPETRIVSPDYLAMIDPTPSGGFMVSGRVENRRSVRVSFVLEYAVGIAPEPTAFAPIAAGSVELGQIADVAGAVPTDSLFRDPTAPPARDFEFAVTLRLSASTTGDGDVARSEIRRTIFVHRDLDLLPGFPRALGRGVVGSPRLADLDGDGREDIIAAADDGSIFAIDATGKDLSGWPVTLPSWSALDPAAPGNHAAAPAFASGAVARDVQESIWSTPSIAAFSAEQTAPKVIISGSDGSLIAFDARGTMLFATRVGGGNSTAPVLYDLDRDGTMEIVQSTADARLVALRANGEAYPGFPVSLPEPCGAPAIGDVDGDERADIVLAGESALHLLRGDGTLAEIALPGLRDEIAPARGLDALSLPAPALADAGGDGRLDLAIAARGRPVLVFAATGGSSIFAAASNRQSFGVRSMSKRTGEAVFATGAPPAIADLDRDGLLEIAAPIAALAWFAARDPAAEVERFTGAWSLLDGSFTSGAPKEIGTPSLGGPAIADLDGDERPEVISAGGEGRLVAFSADGAQPRHWPKLTGGYVIGTPAIGDLDRDGKNDVVALTREGRVFAWRARGPKETGDAWPSFRHDDRATANVETPTILVKLAHLDAECSCASARRDVGAAWITIVLALVWALKNAHLLGARRR